MIFILNELVLCALILYGLEMTEHEEEQTIQEEDVAAKTIERKTFLYKLGAVVGLGSLVVYGSATCGQGSSDSDSSEPTDSDSSDSEPIEPAHSDTSDSDSIEPTDSDTSDSEPIELTDSDSSDS